MKILEVNITRIYTYCIKNHIFIYKYFFSFSSRVRLIHPSCNSSNSNEYVFRHSTWVLSVEDVYWLWNSVSLPLMVFLVYSPLE
eukprot:UN24585